MAPRTKTVRIILTKHKTQPFTLEVERGSADLRITRYSTRSNAKRAAKSLLKLHRKAGGKILWDMSRAYLKGSPFYSGKR